jgi:hypothetical protein
MGHCQPKSCCATHWCVMMRKGDYIGLNVESKQQHTHWLRRHEQKCCQKRHTSGTGSLYCPHDKGLQARAKRTTGKAGPTHDAFYQ